MCLPSAPSAPSAPPPPPPPVDTTDVNNPTFKDAQSNLKKQAALASGQQSTILTSPLGVTGAAPVKQNTLLGI